MSSLFKYEGLVIAGARDVVGVITDMDVDLIVAGNCPLTELTRELKKVTVYKTERAIDGCFIMMMVSDAACFRNNQLQVMKQDLCGVFPVLEAPACWQYW